MTAACSTPRTPSAAIALARICSTSLPAWSSPSKPTVRSTPHPKPGRRRAPAGRVMGNTLWPAQRMRAHEEFQFDGDFRLPIQSEDSWRRSALREGFDTLKNARSPSFHTISSSTVIQTSAGRNTAFADVGHPAATASAASWRPISVLRCAKALRWAAWSSTGESASIQPKDRRTPSSPWCVERACKTLPRRLATETAW